MNLPVAHGGSWAEGLLQGASGAADRGVEGQHYPLLAMGYGFYANSGGPDAKLCDNKQVLHFFGDRAKTVPQLVTEDGNLLPLSEAGQTLVDGHAGGQVVDVRFRDAGLQRQGPF